MNFFRKIDEETKRKICLENVGLENAKKSIEKTEGTFGSDIDKNIVHLNSEGFRSPEFTKEKPENTFRIFILGGSTTFGSGVLDNETYSYYLQEIYDQTDFEFKIEVINTGWPKWSSIQETNLIKEELIDYQPDLFIVYDGINELNNQIEKNKEEYSSELWIERWREVCDLEEEFNFKTLIILQPFVGTGNKILTNQEHKFLINIEKNNFLGVYSSYFDKLETLTNNCALTADFRNIFDHISDPIYYDRSHTGPQGNKIIAEQIYRISLPMIVEGSNNIKSQTFSSNLENPELNDQLILTSDSSIIDDFYFSLRDIILPYKTPRVLPLIFNN